MMSESFDEQIIKMDVNSVLPEAEDSFTFTINAATNVLTAAGHYFQNGSVVKFLTPVPSGLSPETP